MDAMYEYERQRRLTPAQVESLRKAQETVLRMAAQQGLCDSGRIAANGPTIGEVRAEVRKMGPH